MHTHSKEGDGFPRWYDGMWRCVQVLSAINMSYHCLLSVWPGPRGLGALKTSLMIGMCLSNS